MVCFICMRILFFCDIFHKYLYYLIWLNIWKLKKITSNFYPFQRFFSLNTPQLVKLYNVDNEGIHDPIVSRYLT